MPNQRNPLTKERQSDGKDKEFVPMPPTSHTEGVETHSGDRGKVLLEQAKTTAGEAYDTVAEKATSTLEEKKAGLTEGLTSVAQGIRKAGESLDQTKGENYLTEYSAQYANIAADKLEQAARYFQTNDLKAMARDAEDFARRNPAVFLGGAFVLGILAARFFKSSPMDPQSFGMGHMQPDHQLEPGEFERSRSSSGSSAGGI